MKSELRGFTKIFSFTFRHQVGKRGYKNATILIALLCLLIPALIMTGIEYFDQKQESFPETEEKTEYVQTAPKEEVPADMTSLKTIYVVNLGEGKILDTDALAAYDYKTAAGIDLSGVTFTDYGSDLEKASRDSEGSGNTLILLLDEQGSTCQMEVLIPENSGLDEKTAYALEAALTVYGSEAVEQFNADNMTEDADDMTEETLSPMESAKSIMGFVLPYVNIMLLYFFVLFYGQGVAQNVIMEKTSKLMDVFLISVRPAAMIFGKVTAVWLAGIVQLLSWILCLGAGFALGVFGAKTINSQTDMLLVQLFESFGSMASGMFSIGGIIVAILMILAGMMLYCAISGMGGAIAGKPEDLSSANITFTLVLVVSFLAVLYCGGLEGADGGAQWLDWVPFTSIMITPSRILLGSVSVLKGIGCLAVVLVTAFLFILTAGKMYKVMALYKGDLPNGKQLAALIRQRGN